MKCGCLIESYPSIALLWNMWRGSLDDQMLLTQYSCQAQIWVYHTMMPMLTSSDNQTYWHIA